MQVNIRKSILSGVLLGFGITLAVVFGSIRFAGFISPMPILVGLLLAAGLAAWRFPPHRTILLSAIGGSLGSQILAAAGLVIALQGGPLSTRTQDDLKPAQLEHWIGLKLPANATNLRSHAEGFQDWQVFAHFELPQSEVNAFLKRNRFGPQTEGITHFLNDDIHRDWWRPDTTQPFRVFALQPNDPQSPAMTATGFFVTVQLIDRPDGTVSVYLMAFDT
jgi:hypothetical protein